MNDMRNLTAAVLATFLFIASSTVAASFEEPTIPIEQALLLAKQHVATEKIDMTDSYIAKAEWHPRSGLLSYWLIEWRNKKFVKGGDILVTVYADGKAEHIFGK
jgi:hypothetical protein